MEDIKQCLEFIENEASTLEVGQDYELTKYTILKYIYDIRQIIRNEELK